MFENNEAGSDGSFNPAVARNSELLGSNPGRVGCLSSRFVHIHAQCFKLECAVMSMILFTIKNPRSYSMRVTPSFCCDITMIVQRIAIFTSDNDTCIDVDDRYFVVWYR